MNTGEDNMLHFLPPGIQGRLANHRIKRLMPYLGCLAAVLLWSGWIVLSRHGAQTRLSAVDLSFIRFTTALICSIPLWFVYNWRRIPLHELLLISLSAGMVYTTFCFAGMATAKAATAGVLINGLLPVFGAVIGYFWDRVRISPLTWLCILGILLADVMLIGADWQKLGNRQGFIAILLFACASLSFSFYATAVKKWNFLLMDVVIWIPIINFIAILPFWIGSDTGIPATPIAELLLQAIFQGIVVTLFAGFLIAFTIKSLGPITTTMFMASVPGVTALMGYIALREPLTMIEMISVVICMIALLINSRWGMKLRTKTRPLK